MKIVANISGIYRLQFGPGLARLNCFNKRSGIDYYYTADSSGVNSVEKSDFELCQNQRPVV